MKYKRNFSKMSATSVSSISDCEFKFACQRLFDNIPVVPKPVEMVFGAIIHVAHEQIWKTIIGGHSLSETTPKYWQKFLNDVFAGKHGPSGQSTPPIPIRWLIPRQTIDRSESEINDLIEERKQRFCGIAFNSFRAIYLEATADNIFAETKIEFDFSSLGLTIKAVNGINYPISGRIDRIHFWRDGSYIILDLKTGAVSLYYLRNKLVRDIQMTLYQYATEKYFGRRATAIFIQPASPSKSILDKFGADALREIRIPVEIREHKIHYQNLSELIRDANDVIRLVVDRNKYDSKYLARWSPISAWGKMAKFADNVRQGRFIPRIGTWCNSCEHIEICQTQNDYDWAQTNKLEQQKNHETPAPELSSQNTNQTDLLFDLNPPRSSLTAKKIAKGDKLIRNEMIASELFFRKKNLFALINKAFKLIPVVNSAPCPCLRLGLIPITILENIRGIISGRTTGKDLIKVCPHPDCPFKNQPE